MKTLLHFCMLLCLAAADICHSATINLIRSGVSTSLNIGFESTVSDDFGFSGSSGPGNVSAIVDDIADTAAFTNVDLQAVVPASSRTVQRTVITRPTDFPDLRILTNFIETVTIDPISFPVQFVSSTTAPIIYTNDYNFSPDVNLLFPNSFPVSGTYKVQGPTQTVSMPFSITVERSMPNELFIADWVGHIYVGANYPHSARLGAVDESPVSYPNYSLTSPVIFEGTVDGVPIIARYLATHFRVFLPRPIPIPEPSGFCLSALGIAGLCSICFGNRSGPRI